MEQATNPRLLVALYGIPGVGKTRLARYADNGLPPAELDPSLAAAGYQQIHDAPMRQLLVNHGYKGSLNVKDMHNYHAEQRTAGNGLAILEQLRAMTSGIILLDAVHHRQDARHVRELGGYVVAMTAPIKVCEERYVSDDHDEKHQNVIDDQVKANMDPQDPKYFEFLERAKRRAWGFACREMAHGFGTGKVADLITFADGHIDNSGTTAEGMGQLVDLLSVFSEREESKNGMRLSLGFSAINAVANGSERVLAASAA